MIKQMLAITKKDLRDLSRNMTLLFLLILPLGLGLLYNFIPDSTIQVGHLGPEPTFMGDDDDMQLIPYSDREALLADARKDLNLAIILGEDQESLEVFAKEGSENLVDLAIFLYAASQAAIDTESLHIEHEILASDEPRFDIRSHLGSMSILLAIVLVGLMIMPTLLVSEKEQGTMRAMVTAGIRFSTIIGSKAVTGFLLCSAAALLSGVVSRTSVESLGTYLWSITLGSVFVTITGLIIASLTEDETSLNELATLAMLLFIAPATLVNFNMPAWVDQVLGFLPTHWLYQSLQRAMQQGMTLTDSLLSLALLLAANALAFLAAIVILRRASQRIV